MINQRRGSILIRCFVLLALAVGFASGATGNTTNPDDIPDPVALVNGQPITRDMFFQRLVDYHGVYVLENLIGEILLAAEADKMQAEVSQQEIDKRVAERREASRVVSDEAFRSLLLQNEYTETRYKDEVRLAILAEKAFADRARVSDKEVADYYNNNKASFLIPATATIQVLLANTEQIAQKALEMLRQGKDYTTVRKELSAGLQPTRDRPVVIPLERMPTSLRLSVERARMGEPFGPIKVPQEYTDPKSPAIGYQVVEVIERQAERQKTFEEVKEEIRRMLFNQRMYGTLGVWKRWMTTERDNAEVEIMIGLRGEPLPEEARAK